MHRWTFPLALALAACAPPQRLRAPTSLADCAPAARAKRAFSVAAIPSLAGSFTVVLRDTANTSYSPVTDSVTLRAVDSSLVPKVARWERYDGRSQAIDSLPRLVSPAGRVGALVELVSFEWRLYERGVLMRGIERRMHATPNTYTIEWVSERGFGGRWTQPWGYVIMSLPDGSSPRPYAGVFCAIRRMDGSTRPEKLEREATR